MEQLTTWIESFCNFCSHAQNVWACSPDGFLSNMVSSKPSSPAVDCMSEDTLWLTHTGAQSYSLSPSSGFTQNSVRGLTRPNNKTVMSLEISHSETILSPKGPNLPDAFCHLWQYPHCELENETGTGKPVIHHAQCLDVIYMTSHGKMLSAKYADLNTDYLSISSFLLECELIGFSWISEPCMRRIENQMNGIASRMRPFT